MNNVRFVSGGEWSGIAIHEMKNGWVVETWSRISGQMTGVKYTVPFNRSFPSGTDLYEEWNEGTTKGVALYERSSPGRILRKGIRVR